MWIRSENGENVKPSAVERCQDLVIVRRNFRHIEENEDYPAHWEWEEWQMSAEQYEVYQAMKQESDDLSDALIELAEIVIGGD